MKVLHTADWHINRRHPHYTLKEQVDCLTSCAYDSYTLGAEVCLVAGDVFECQHAHVTERNASMLAAMMIAELMPVVIVRGNHDGTESLDFFGSLRTQYPIHTYSTLDTVEIGGVKIAAVPWIRHGYLQARLPDGVDVDQAGAHMITQVMQGLHAQRPDVIVGHLEVGGASYDNGLAARAVSAVSAHDLIETGAAYIALGHIHQEQAFTDGRIRYSGSAWQTRRGEDRRKGMCVVDLDDRHLTTIRSDLPPMIDIEHTASNPTTLEIDIEPAHYLVRYETTNDDARRDRDTMEEIRREIMRKGAMSCSMRPMVTVCDTPRRVSDMPTSVADKLYSYWQGTDKPRRAADIMAKRAQIMEGDDV